MYRHQYIWTSSGRIQRDLSIREIKEILPKATIVVNILPLTDQTKGLFDAKSI